MESPVPRYYFNIINGSKIVDVEGREFPDSAAAVAEAQRLIDDWELPGTQMQVTDAKAREIARVQRRPTTGVDNYCISAFGGITPSALSSSTSRVISSARSAKRCHV
jgi:hypothetical protein